VRHALESVAYSNQPWVVARRVGFGADASAAREFLYLSGCQRDVVEDIEEALYVSIELGIKGPTTPHVREPDQARQAVEQRRTGAPTER